MASPLIERMKALCALPGPPGHEGAVRDAIAGMVRESASELRRDAAGNLIARHEARAGAPHRSPVGCGEAYTLAPKRSISPRARGSRAGGMTKSGARAFGASPSLQEPAAW